MLRRAVLKLLSGSAALLVAKPQLAKAALPEDDLVPIPDWCPKGFLPMMGQKITPKQFPGLFEAMKFPSVPGSRDRYFYPIYWNKPYGIVEELPVEKILSYRPPKLDEKGNLIISDNGTGFILEDAKDVTSVTLIATEPFRWPNGSLAPPGFQTKIVVDKNKFESFYRK